MPVNALAPMGLLPVSSSLRFWLVQTRNMADGYSIGGMRSIIEARFLPLHWNRHRPHGLQGGSGGGHTRVAPAEGNEKGDGGGHDRDGQSSGTYGDGEPEVESRPIPNGQDTRLAGGLAGGAGKE